MNTIEAYLNNACNWDKYPFMARAYLGDSRDYVAGSRILYGRFMARFVKDYIGKV